MARVNFPIELNPSMDDSTADFVKSLMDLGMTAEDLDWWDGQTDGMELESPQSPRRLTGAPARAGMDLHRKRADSSETADAPDASSPA